MLGWPPSLQRLFRRRNPAAETSRLIVGSTGSGKSEGELADLIRLADRGDHAVVLLDGHGPLAFRAAGHWAARGHEARMVFEPLDEVGRALTWDMLPATDAPSSTRRRIEAAEAADEVAQCFLAQRNLATLNDRPWTKEWLEAAIALCLSQPEREPITSLALAFRPGSPGYERLLARTERAELVAKFRDAERLRRKNEVQWEIMTGAARRILEPVCGSEVVRLRCRPGPFAWLEALRRCSLIAFDGGGLRSTEVKRTLFLVVSMHVIAAVRRHFAETQAPLPVVLILEEAGALGLVTPFVLSALQELRKAGLAIHLITQSHLDFGDPALFEVLLANSPSQVWYQCLSPADQELGAKALANATFDSLAVHFTRTRAVPTGSEPAETVSQGASFDHASGAVRSDTRTATAYRTRYREVTDPVYKSPMLHDQELRTRLATLRVGERFVRSRDGVRRERGRPVRPPRLGEPFEAFTRAAIERVRSGPAYLPCPSEQSGPAPELPPAAMRLRGSGQPPVLTADKGPAPAAIPEAGG
jgi:hypothetical protein